ncbi:hypothetical protein OJAV_G00169570 [Oryzias javanicus]|uniref:Uncharacterized protein n=1 Tax=Oryzias javanicus TaxID=123683 RepID=A0A3S2MKN2_ORYJA|nr:hypothetical protein OJAV_G00169570 [Oryzias javanicus]
MEISGEQESDFRRVEIQQKHIMEEEDDEWQPSKQGRNSSLDQGGPEPPQIKEDPEEQCSDQEEEQNQETDVKVEFKSEYGETTEDSDNMFEFNEEMDQQYCVRNIIRIPERQLHEIDVPQGYEYKKEDDPEPLQIKEEPEEPWGNQEGEQLLPHQEPDVKVEFMSECEEKSEDSENFMFEFKQETDQECSLQNIIEDSEVEPQNKATSSTSTGSHLDDQETFDPPTIAGPSTLNRKRKRKTRLDATDVMNAFLEIQQQQHEEFMRAEELRHQQETQMLRDWMKADREMEERHLELQSQTNHMFERIMTRLLDFMVPPTHQKMSRAQQTPQSFYLDY